MSFYFERILLITKFRRRALSSAQELPLQVNQISTLSWQDVVLPLLLSSQLPWQATIFRCYFPTEHNKWKSCVFRATLGKIFNSLRFQVWTDQNIISLNLLKFKHSDWLEIVTWIEAVNRIVGNPVHWGCEIFYGVGSGVHKCYRAYSFTTRYLKHSSLNTKC